MKKAGLMQQKSSLTKSASVHQVPDGGVGGGEGVLPSDFFTHDAEKMDELNPFPNTLPKGCHPKCMWSCGKTECDQVCTPVCAPPKCVTKCGALDIGSCNQMCDPPKCVVVCPTVQCEHAECPKCKTVCAPPVCHTDCAENCDSQCADPTCSWTCKPSAECVKPQCALDCTNEKVCNLNADVNARPSPPLLGDGSQIVSQSLAYILPQPGPLANGQGPLFMPGAFAPNATGPAAAAAQPGAASSPSPPPAEDQRAVFLRNGDGKGGMPIKGDR